MSDNEAVETELSTSSALKKPTVEIPGATSVDLQTLDLARHIAIAPDGKRYVVATFDGTHVGQKYVIAVYPQQGNYLTLIRLPVCQLHAELPDDAVQRHIALVQAIQKGKLKTYLSENQ
jgi:hypothetical protein